MESNQPIPGNLTIPDVAHARMLSGGRAFVLGPIGDPRQLAVLYGMMCRARERAWTVAVEPGHPGDRERHVATFSELASIEAQALDALMVAATPANENFEYVYDTSDLRLRRFPRWARPHN